MSQYQIEFSKLNEELRLARRLEQHGASVFIGLTTHESRREAFRKAIIDSGKDCVIAGTKPGTDKPETYAQFFERLFGEPLKRKQTKG